MKKQIEDLKEHLIEGVAVQLPGSVAAEKGEYFQFTPAALIAGYKTSRIGSGVLRSLRHKVEFRVAEYHEDRETFIFVSGTAVMLFLDLENGRAKMETAHLVRIKEGTKIIIEPGKGHFVPVAEGNETVCAVVEAPSMPAIKVELPEAVSAV
jgi:mannose-6-phosphate isomerase-like protein (cupin superfamily)